MKNTNLILRRITDIYIYIILLIYPLFLGFRGYTQLTYSKFAFFLITTLLWLLGLVIIHIMYKIKPKFNINNPITLCLLLFLLLNIVSAIFSEYGITTFLGLGRFDGLLTTLLCIAIFGGVSQFAHPKQTYFLALALSVSICCIISIIQFFGFNPLNLFPSNFDYYDKGLKFSGEFLGTIGNADLASAFLCIATPLFSVLYITNTTKSKLTAIFLLTSFLAFFCLLHCTVAAGKLSLLITIILSMPFIIVNTERLKKSLHILAIMLLALSISEAFGGEKINGEILLYFKFTAKIAILVAMSILAIFLSFLIRAKTFKKKNLQIFFSVVSISIIVFGFVYIYRYNGQDGSLYEASQIMHGNFDDSFGSSRIRIWRDSLKAFPKNPVLGSGPGTLVRQIDIRFSRYVEETGRTLACKVDNAHNFYIGTLINSGIFSVLLFIAAQFITLIKSVKHKHGYIGCIATALLCYWIQSFFGLELFITTPFMWLLWGLIVNLLYQETPKLKQ